ncbi:hypothetical protein Tco_0111910 [Tanacetum coccineum]
MVVIYNHHTHPLVAAVVVVYDDVRVAVLGLPWGGSGRGDGDGDGDDVGGVMVSGKTEKLSGMSFHIELL